MSNCAKCGKRFTCGCQKTYDENGVAICKTCAAKQTNTGSSMNLAQQKINNLKSS